MLSNHQQHASPWLSSHCGWDGDPAVSARIRCPNRSTIKEEPLVVFIGEFVLCLLVVFTFAMLLSHSIG